MRLFASIFALVALCGCRSPNSFDEWRSDDKRFTPQEREVVLAARSYMEKRFHTAIDGFYRVREEPEGYSVVVWVPVCYEHGQPQFAPGSSAIVELNRNLTVEKYLQGY